MAIPLPVGPRGPVRLGLKSLNTDEGITVVCATHDLKMLSSSERVCWIRDGRLEKISSGTEFSPDEMAPDELGR